MKKGDKLDQLFVELGESTYAILISRGANHHEAEDVIQETYYKMITLLPELSSQQLKPWFFRVAFNQFIDDKRKQNKSINVSEDFFNQLLSESGKELSYQKIDDLDEINYEFQRIRADYQEILTLKYYYELSYKEIAEILEIQPNSVKQKLSRARQSILKERNN